MPWRSGRETQVLEWVRASVKEAGSADACLVAHEEFRCLKHDGESQEDFELIHIRALFYPFNS